MPLTKILAYVTILISAPAWVQFCSATDVAPSSPLSVDQHVIPSYGDCDTSAWTPSFCAGAPTAPPPLSSRSLTLDPMLESRASTEKHASQPIEITKKQLEKLLGLALDTTFNLKVMSDNSDFKAGNEVGDSGSELLGTIPVHLKIKELKIGGILAPKIETESLNLKVDPSNFGNIKIG
ncbi:hypothetical protein BGZ80_000722 [Entomortierella chlamydospora]|uniref:Uncharacterized protein n=1 Tax=Entomortierella chlamydospora TaxID=101097 RepID=A0A9P6SY88_9FUNG|nr:hypothetical protein BGZ79_000730 [Entomortierella chlamydospora]KAG0011394.1 hypothetical protein BGZ80_000722 [Entomortierella chlamydospora]